MFCVCVCGKLSQCLLAQASFDKVSTIVQLLCRLSLYFSDFCILIQSIHLSPLLAANVFAQRLLSLHAIPVISAAASALHPGFDSALRTFVINEHFDTYVLTFAQLLVCHQTFFRSFRSNCNSRDSNMGYGISKRSTDFSYLNKRIIMFDFLKGHRIDLRGSA